MSEDQELPAGWCWTTIEDLAGYVQRGKSPKYTEHSELPVINQKCIRWDGVQPEHLKFIERSQWEAWAPERTLRDGDILWNSTGTGTIGRAAIYRPLKEYKRVVADSHVTVVRLRLGSPEYLHSWIRSPAIQSRIDAMQSGSTNQVELGRMEVLQTRVPLPPLNEQRRIVAKLETLQSKSRKAREHLEAIPALLHTLRQSILAAAFRGDLTKSWREQNKDVEPASELLKRIRKERRRKWEEAELLRMKAKGKAPRDDAWKGKYQEPEAVDTAGLPELPSGWCWASVEELLDKAEDLFDGPFGSGLKTSDYVSEGARVIRLENIGNLEFRTDKLTFISTEKYQSLKRHSVGAGDIIFGSFIEETTRVCILPILDGPAIAKADCFCIRPDVRVIQAGFLLFVLGSQYARNELTQDIHGATRPRINTSHLRRLRVPLPPIPEQGAIIEALEDAFSAVRRMRNENEDWLQELTSLDRAILAKAFKGQLVPQDPNDEPALITLQKLKNPPLSLSSPPQKPKSKRSKS